MGVSSSSLLRTTTEASYGTSNGGLAQLARAPALHAGGQRFESVILHFSLKYRIEIFDILDTRHISNIKYKLKV